MSVIAPPKYKRNKGASRVIPPRASPAPSLPHSRSRSRSATPGGRPRCSHCNAATLVQDEGSVVCQTCGVVVEQDANFRAEIEFDESSSGAIKTRGTHIGAGQSHSKNYTSRIAGQSHVGQEATASSERAEGDAKSRMQYIANSLKIHDPQVKKALYLFRQAYARQFYRGRTLDSVAVVCLYLAVRQCRGGEKYPLMLIDFAEQGMGLYNVFELGKMAKELQEKLYLDVNRGLWHELEQKKKDATEVEKAELNARQLSIAKDKDFKSLQLVDPEDLIERFCEKLDFGDAQRTVMNDAVRVAKSMNRDWMTTGRRPAGIAGAAVIIAARMNNFRRTLREVVLVVKVTEITISKRIEEFKETSSSTLSVQQFRAADPSQTKPAPGSMPPSLYRTLPEWQEKEASKKRGKKRKSGKQAETATEIENGEDAEMETQNEPEAMEEIDTNEPVQLQAKRPRLDADGFAVPDIPTRPSATRQVDSSEPRKAGRPQRAKNWQPPPPTEADLEEENELTEDIRDQLRRNASLDPTGSIARSESQDDVEVMQPAPGTGVLDIYPAPKPSDSIGPLVDSSIGNTGSVSMDETLGGTEFEDDPDVANCVLNEIERNIKETIWVTENADWLRTEHAKKIKRELKDRELREKGIDPEKERMKKIRRKDGMQRAGRAGDISYLEEARNKKRKEDDPAAEANGQASGENDEEQRRSASVNARESVTTMLQQRGTFSRRVDYTKLSQAYVLPGFEDSSESRSESPVSDPTRFFRAHTSRGYEASNKRRARDTLSRIAGAMSTYETDGETDVEGGRSRSRSAPKATQDETGEADEDEDEDDDAASEQESTALETSDKPSKTSSARQLPTPAPTQSQPKPGRVSPRHLSQSQGPARETPIVIDENNQDANGHDTSSTSPLSSTHTPAGYASGAPGTPQSQPKPGDTQADPEEVESEGDEDDYVDDGDEEADDDPDKYFEDGAEELMGEAEEVIEDEV